MTPRTEAILTEIWTDPHDPGHYVPQKMIDLARELERELTEAKAIIHEQRERIVALKMGTSQMEPK